MKTITFYSYKGGAGRSLLVANMALYLARFGQRVLAVDFDLEAPGLHYKLSGGDEPLSVERGVVDIVRGFLTSGNLPPLTPYVMTVESAATSSGSVGLLPAGAVPSAEYWEHLARIDWHHFFYSDVNPQGIPFFLELKEAIREEVKPDFLLIDARTGITEIGSLATSFLPDKLVCLTLNNRENLDGTRAVLRAVAGAERLKGQSQPELIVVLSRLPVQERVGHDERVAEEVRQFLNLPAANVRNSVSLSEVVILHSEPVLQLEERLLVNTAKTVDESVLLRDYLKLFSRLVSADVVKPYISELVSNIRGRLFEDPDSAQVELESLADFVTHPEVYRELIKFYRVRNVNDERVIRAAERIWEFTRNPREPVLWEVVRDFSRFLDPYRRHRPSFLLFAETVWRAAGANDADVGIRLIRAYRHLQVLDRAASLAEELLKAAGPVEEVLVEYLSLLRATHQWELATSVVDLFRAQILGSSLCLTEWARLVVTAPDSALPEELLDAEAVSRISMVDLRAAVNLLKSGGRENDANRLLDTRLEEALREGDLPAARDLGVLFVREGRLRDFDLALRGVFDEDSVKNVMRDVRLRRPRSVARSRRDVMSA